MVCAPRQCRWMCISIFITNSFCHTKCETIHSKTTKYFVNFPRDFWLVFGRCLWCRRIRFMRNNYYLFVCMHLMAKFNFVVVQMSLSCVKFHCNIEFCSTILRFAYFGRHHSTLWATEHLKLTHKYVKNDFRARTTHVSFRFWVQNDNDKDCVERYLKTREKTDENIWRTSACTEIFIKLSRQIACVSAGGSRCLVYQMNERN